MLSPLPPRIFNLIQRNAEEFGNYFGDKRRAEAALTTSHSRSYALFDTVNRRNAYRGFQSVENFALADLLAAANNLAVVGIFSYHFFSCIVVHFAKHGNTFANGIIIVVFFNRLGLAEHIDRKLRHIDGNRGSGCKSGD